MLPIQRPPSVFRRRLFSSALLCAVQALKRFALFGDAAAVSAGPTRDTSSDGAAGSIGVSCAVVPWWLARGLAVRSKARRSLVDADRNGATGPWLAKAPWGNRLPACLSTSLGPGHH